MRAEFADAYPEMYHQAYRAAFPILGSRAEAEEVAQESLAKAWARWSAVRGHSEAWVATVAANEAIDIWRRRQRTGRLPVTDASTPEHVVDLRINLVRALRRLPRRQREVVVLRYLVDLPEQAVAEALSISVGTVKSHAARGINALSHLLDPPFPGITESPDSPAVTERLCPDVR